MRTIGFIFKKYVQQLSYSSFETNSTTFQFFLAKLAWFQQSGKDILQDVVVLRKATDKHCFEKYKHNIRVVYQLSYYLQNSLDVVFRFSKLARTFIKIIFFNNTLFAVNADLTSQSQFITLLADGNGLRQPISLLFHKAKCVSRNVQKVVLWHSKTHLITDF